MSARGWLNWSQVELARRANVSARTVQTFEGAQKPPHPNSIAAMQRAMEMAGILFLFAETGEAAGIVRQDADDDPRPLIFEKKGTGAGVLRPHRTKSVD
jgi:transcriptional regulator with XRE-family HTH domain